MLVYLVWIFLEVKPWPSRLSGLGLSSICWSIFYQKDWHQIEQKNLLEVSLYKCLLCHHVQPIVHAARSFGKSRWLECGLAKKFVVANTFSKMGDGTGPWCHGGIISTYYLKTNTNKFIYSTRRPSKPGRELPYRLFLFFSESSK